MVGILARTTVSANLKDQSVSSKTTLGNVACRKTLKAAFPFVELKCQDTSKRP